MSGTRRLRTLRRQAWPAWGDIRRTSRNTYDATNAKQQRAPDGVPWTR